MSNDRRTLRCLLSLLFYVISIETVSAATWSSSNVQFLRGSGYELGEDEKTIFTFEHSNHWTHGDNFFFVDVSSPGSSGTSLYAEFTPRLSISKLSGISLATDSIKDIFLAGGIEMGEDLHAQLLGIGVSLDIAGFSYLNTNIYLRKSKRDQIAENTDTGGQVNINWRLPFTSGNMQWIFEGHLDYAFSENGGSNPKANNLNSAPRLLLDLGQFHGTPGHLFAGIEYQLWRNKFGIDGIDEDVAQVMLKWVF